MIFKKEGIISSIGRNVKRNKNLFIMLFPIVLFYIVFCYYPMYGAQIAFRNYKPKLGIWGSEWVGLKNFYSFFHDVYFSRLIKNTLVINIQNLVFGFPIPILLALLLNEVRNLHFKKTVQTITYLPHFISAVVIAGMILNFTGTDGFITELLTSFGFQKRNMLTVPAMFQPIYVLSGIWQEVGWSSIIYIAAISGINSELYEAAEIDGAGKFKQVLHVTLPGILPTIITMLILQIGNMMSLGSEKILLLYNPSIYKTSDVISTYVYRKGLLDLNFSYSTAVGLFNSVINLILLISANKICKKLTDSSLW